MFVTNLSTNVQTKFFSRTNSFNIAITAGNYNMYMGTLDAKFVDPFLKFSASTPSVTISSASNSVSLTAETRQQNQRLMPFPHCLLGERLITCI